MLDGRKAVSQWKVVAISAVILSPVWLVGLARADYTQIEEWADWIHSCKPGTCADIGEECDTNCDPNVTGTALVLDATSEELTFTEYTYESNSLPVDPNTTYEIGVSLKVANHTPPYGQYSIEIEEQPILGTPGVKPLLVPPYRAIDHASQDWFDEYGYYKTSPTADYLEIRIKLTQSFEGELYIDNLNIVEVNTHIEDKYLRIPIDYEFEGMKIVDVCTGVPYVETNAAKFVFDQNSIELQKKKPGGTDTVGTILFLDDPCFLSGLSIEQDVNGLVILENNDMTISIGADSSILAKFDPRLAATPNNVFVTGMASKYFNFEAGIIFVSDYQKGLLFAPIHPDLNLSGWGRFGSSVRWDNLIISDTNYPDDAFDDIGFKTWSGEPNFLEVNWDVSYTFDAGEGFVASVFPPKDFNETKYAKERHYPARNQALQDKDYGYLIQKAKERANIVKIRNFTPSDRWLHGPYSPLQHLTNVVEAAHEQDVRVTVYLAPAYYYTSDPCILLEDVNNLIDACDIDGIYYDGYLRYKPLKTLELVRRTRNLLKDKFWEQHSSWQNVLARTDHIRVPFYDAYADWIFLGEVSRKDFNDWDNFGKLTADVNNWGLLYCNKNLSNCPSTIRADYRDVNCCETPEGNKEYVTLTPGQQIGYMLDFNGVMELWGRWKTKDWLEECISGEYTPYLRATDYWSPCDETTYQFEPYYFDSRDWWDPYDQKCLQWTKDDGVADIGETIYSAREDCAPTSAQAGLLRKSADTYECITDYSVAQWIIDGNQPFYRFHYTFDANLATEDSDNKMSPDRFTGVGEVGYEDDPNYLPPEPCDVDGRESFYFDGTKRLYGDHDETLCFMDGNNITDFSSFAAVKRDSSSTSKQIVFDLNRQTHLGKSRHFQYGIDQSKFYVTVRNNSNVVTTYDSGAVQINDSSWHTIGLVYEADSNTLTLYVDGNDVNQATLGLYEFPEFGLYGIGAWGSHTFAQDHFKGYMDDLFVTDLALTQTQIDQYHQTLHKKLTIEDLNDVYCIVNKDGDKYTAEYRGVWNITQDSNYATIQAAIDDATNGDEIVVFEGTYKETIDLNGLALTLHSSNPNDPNVVAATIIDANGADRAVYFHNSETSSSVLRGFTVTGAARSGIYCYDHVSPTISDCNITGNGSASYDGGGMYIDYYCSPEVRDCVFSNNAGDWGGGLYIEDSTPDVLNCVFVDNLADDGGGMAIYDCSPRVINCVFYQNEADNDGGGLYIENEGDVNLINCTLYDNYADDDGGGIFCYDLATVYITNCILWGNEAGDSGGEIHNDDCDVYVENCDIEEGVNGDKCGGDSLDDEGGNDDEDPEFEDASDPDGNDTVWGTCDDGLRIESTSPCKDEGDDDWVPEGVDTDIKGSDRIINGDVDMGAYEYDSGC